MIMKETPRVRERDFSTFVYEEKGYQIVMGKRHILCVCVFDDCVTEFRLLIYRVDAVQKRKQLSLVPGDRANVD